MTIFREKDEKLVEILEGTVFFRNFAAGNK